MPLQRLSQTRVALTILWERVSVCACVPCSCFLESLYRADDTTTIVLTVHSDPFCNDNCPKQLRGFELERDTWKETPYKCDVRF